MPITQRGSSFQVEINHLKTRYRRAFKTRPEAELWELESKVRLLKGQPLDMGEGPAQAAPREPQGSSRAGKRGPGPYTLGELREYVWDRFWAHQRSSQAADINSRAVVSILGSATPFARLNVSHLDEVVAALRRKGDTPATINRKLSALSKMLSVAEGLDRDYRKPRFDRLKETKGRNFRYTAEIEAQALTFWRTIGHPEMADYAVLSVETGMRQGEALNLTWKAVDDRFIRLDGSDCKSGIERAIPITPRAREVLDRLRGRSGGARSEHVLGFDKAHVRHYWNRMAEAVQLDTEPAFVPHIMRHEFGSRLADRGINATAIQRLMGHSSITTTQRYIHMSPTALEAAMNAMSLD